MVLSRLRDALRKNTVKKRLAEARIFAEFGNGYEATMIYAELKCGRNPDPEVFAEEAAYWARRGRVEEAELMLAAVLNRYPVTERLWVDYAALAERRRDWNEACRRWDDVRIRFPATLRAYTGLGEAFRRLGKLTEADAMLGAARELASKDQVIAVTHARLAAERKDWAEAVRRWTTIRERFPGNADGYAGGALALRASRRFTEAEELAATGVKLFPASAPVLIQFARCAVDRRDWESAVRRWERVLGVDPDNKMALEGISQARKVSI